MESPANVFTQCMGTLGMKFDDFYDSPQPTPMFPQAATVVGSWPNPQVHRLRRPISREIHVRNHQKWSEMERSQQDIFYKKKLKQFGFGSSENDAVKDNKLNRDFWSSKSLLWGTSAPAPPTAVWSIFEIALAFSFGGVR